MREQLNERDKTIEELRNRPLPTANSEKSRREKEIIQETLTPMTHSPENLLKIIEEHKQEIQKLKALMAEKSSQEEEITQETSLKQIIQNLPKKMPVLFGYAY